MPSTRVFTDSIQQHAPEQQAGEAPNFLIIRGIRDLAQGWLNHIY
jgi:hypothetical protein